MDKKEIVLAGLSPANGGLHSPVQVQKLFFLIDRNLGKAVNGPHFDFRPYNYGPYDKSVYNVLEELEQNGLVEVIQLNWKEYRLTDAGQKAGVQLLSSLEPKNREYIQQASEFVRKLTFSQLVSAIYKAYPDMRVNSVFQG